MTLKKLSICKCRTFAAVVVSLLCLVVAGATHEWNPNGSGGWGDSTRWKGGGTPGAGDTVSFSGCTGTVTAADAAYLSGISEVTFANGGGLEFSNDAGEAELSCGAKFTGDGVLIKRGSGVARLTCVETATRQAFYMTRGIEIYGGTFFMPRNNSKECFITRLAVYDPGVFVQAGGSAVSYVEGGLYGDGTISNDVSKTFRVYGEPTNSVPIPVFSGKFMNLAYFVTYGSAGGRAQHLTGVSGSTTSRDLLLYGQDYVLGVATLGTDQHPASWGKGIVQWRGVRPWLRYLGDGETSGKTFFFGNGGKDATLDAGDHGGLVLTGDWSTSSTENNFMNAITFTGCGTNVFAAKYTTTTDKNGRYIGHYVTKAGDGAWRFTAGKTRDMRSVFETRRGELQFESIAEKGVMCSLGDASLLHSRYVGDINDAKAVDYAYLVGDGETGLDDPHLATMNYVGGSAASVSTRPFAVKGAGRLKSDNAFLDWGGITAASSGSHTAVLGGDAEMACASSVTNGPGSLSVVKDGAGAWTVSGDYDFSGDVAVRDGRLRLAGTRYEWYRLTIMQTWKTGTDPSGNEFPGDGSNFVLRHWALLDDNGADQVENIPHNTAADGKPWALAPGEAAMANTNYLFLGRFSGVIWKYALSNLFSTVTINDWNYNFSAVNADPWGGYYGLDHDISYTQSWVRVVVRLPKGASPVTHYDLKANSYIDQGGESAAARIPRSWMVEGSVDGISWTPLDTVISNAYENAVSGGSGRWFSNNKTTLGAGYGPYPSGEGARVRPASLSSVSAASGTVLESMDTLSANGITYDCAGGGGTLSGFTFATDTSVRIVNCDASALGGGKVVFPLDLSGCTGLDDTSRWTLSINGTPTSSRRLRVSNDGIVIVSTGFCISFR